MPTVVPISKSPAIATRRCRISAVTGSPLRSISATGPNSLRPLASNRIPVIKNPDSTKNKSTPRWPSSVSHGFSIACAGPVCWHTHEAYDYPRESRVIVHPDDWHWGRHERFAFREHEGRGYWNSGRWREW